MLASGKNRVKQAIIAAVLWNLTLAGMLQAQSVLVDDMESYDNSSNGIKQTWIDGPGSAVSLSTTIFHGGKQAMQLDYDNSTEPSISETERTFDPPLDLTGICEDAVLTIWYRGVPSCASGFAFDPPMATYTVTGCGRDIGGMSDEFRYAYRLLQGDGTIMTRLDSIQDTHPWAKAGLMIRETVDPDSAHATLAITPQQGLWFGTRDTKGGNSQETVESGLASPLWLRLDRIGDNISAAYSDTGVTWTPLGDSVSIPMPAEVYIGLAVSSHNPPVACPAQFSNVTIAGTIVAGGWQSQDIGMASNSAEPLYVVLEDGDGVLAVHPDPTAVQSGSWQRWSIALKHFEDAGLLLSSVSKMYIGVGDRTSPQAGGTGTIYIDDIMIECPTPFTASNCDPQDGAVCVDPNTLLNWTAGDTAAFHNVYFGTNKADVINGDAGTFRGQQTYTTYDPGALAPCTDYYWRIDEVDADGFTIYKGDVWSFTTGDSGTTSLIAYAPDPADGAICVPLDQDLNWSPGCCAAFHDVYFGTNEVDVINGAAGTFRGRQTYTTYDPGALAPCIDYYWRIDEVDADGFTIYKGDVWSFTTTGCPCECLRVRVSQESSPGKGDFDENELGCIDVFETDESAKDYYKYDLGCSTSFSNLAFTLTPNRSHLFFVCGCDGLSLFIVHDKPFCAGDPKDPDGGIANMYFQLFNDTAVRTVEDDPSFPDSYPLSGPTAFTSNQSWGAPSTDGQVITGLDGDWSMLVEFTEHGGLNPGEVGLDSWFVYSANGRVIPLVLQDHRRVRLDCIECGCPTKTYNDEADWNEGVFTGTKVVDHNGCLELLDPSDPCAATPYPYAWLANSGEGTVSKVDIYTGNEVARYRTGPPKASGDYSYLSPSRTTVDENGNCWVANRAEDYQGSVTKILLEPPEGGTTCKDLDPVNSNGHGIINLDEMLPWGQDSAVERHYLVGGESVPRALAIDHEGFLWVGLHNEARCIRLDPEEEPQSQNDNHSFSPVKNILLQTYNTNYAQNAPRPKEFASVDLRNLDESVNSDLSPYGMALSPNGRLYVSEHQSEGWVVEINPVSAELCQSHHVPEGSPYGIAVDRNCIVWMADQSEGRCIRWNPKEGAQGFTYGSGAESPGAGITAHPNGGIWMACYTVDKVAKFDGSLVEPVATNYPTGAVLKADCPVGIGVGADGSIIAVGKNNDTWSKLSPQGTVIPLKGPQKTGPAPYTYSDFTGSIANQARQQGFWTAIFDSGVPGQKWGRVSWVSQNDNPPETSVSVEVRAANAQEDLGNKGYIKVSNGVEFDGVSGRYIQVRVKLSRKRPSAEDCNSVSCEDFPVSPRLCELTVDANCTPCRIICPNDIVVDCNSPGDGGAWVDLPMPTLAGDCNESKLQCNYDSPHFFTVGTTKVTCTAYDMQDNLVECYYYVTVECPNDANGACCYLDYRDGFVLTCVPGVTERECNEVYNGFYLGNNSTCEGDVHDICPACVRVPYNAVAWWPLDEDGQSGYADDIAQFNNRGSYVSDVVGDPGPTPTPAWPTGQGLVGYALEFDGQNDYVEVDDHLEINFGIGDFSIDAWIKTDSYMAPFSPIVDKRTTKSGYAFFLHYGYPALALADPTASGFAEFIGVGPDAFIADGTWHNVAVTLDRNSSTGLNLYVDAKLPPVATFNPMGKSGSLDNDANLLIGKGYGISGPETYFDGILDELEMFDDVLTFSAIQRIADANDNGKCKEYAHVTKFMSCCPGEPGIMVLSICNLTPYYQPYFWKASGVIGTGCDFAGPSGNGTVWVKPGECVSVEIPFKCGSGMTGLYGATACCHVTVRNWDGQIVASIGTLRATRWCADPAPVGPILPRGLGPVPFIKFVDGNSPSVKVPFNITNMDDPCEVFNYRIEARGPDGMLDDNFISLNGLPPGSSVEGSVPLAIGETIQLSVDVEFTDHEGSVFFDIVLLADVDGYGTYQELASRSVRSVLCCETIDESRRKGDLDLNCRIQFHDVALLASAWLSELGEPDYNPDFDIAANGVIDFWDLAALVDNWLEDFVCP